MSKKTKAPAPAATVDTPVVTAATAATEATEAAATAAPVATDAPPAADPEATEPGVDVIAQANALAAVAPPPVVSNPSNDSRPARLGFGINRDPQIVQSETIAAKGEPTVIVINRDGRSASPASSVSKNVVTLKEGDAGARFVVHTPVRPVQ